MRKYMGDCIDWNFSYLFLWCWVDIIWGENVFIICIKIMIFCIKWERGMDVLKNVKYGILVYVYK